MSSVEVAAGDPPVLAAPPGDVSQQDQHQQDAPRGDRPAFDEPPHRIDGCRGPVDRRLERLWLQGRVSLLTRLSGQRLVDASPQKYRRRADRLRPWATMPGTPSMLAD